MLFHISKGLSVSSSVRRHDPKCVTHRLIEAGYEVSSEFETYLFFQIFWWSFIVAIVDWKARERKLSTEPFTAMPEVWLPPPPEAKQSNIVKFPIRSSR